MVGSSADSSRTIPALNLGAIDRGEAEVIEYARLNGNLPVIIDDRRARRVAERLGLKVHGTIGIVAAATSAENFTEAFRGNVLSLRIAGLYVSDDVINVLKKRIGSRTS
jgi:predicted nucleic acid-binding protein